VGLVWKRRFASWPAALHEERRIKGLPRPAKLLLVLGSGVASSVTTKSALGAGATPEVVKKRRK
jgi:predicted GIY-YIG superfamily endonuclease